MEPDPGQRAPPGEQPRERTRQQRRAQRGGHGQQQGLQGGEPCHPGAGGAAGPQQPRLRRAVGGQQPGHQQQGARGEQGELEHHDQQRGAGDEQGALDAVQGGGQVRRGGRRAVQGGRGRQRGHAPLHGGAQRVDPAGGHRGEVGRRQPAHRPRAHPAPGQHGGVGEQRAVRGEVHGDDAAAGEFVELPVGRGGVGRAVEAGDAHPRRGALQPVVQGDPGARPQAQLTGGGDGEGDFDLRSRGRAEGIRPSVMRTWVRSSAAKCVRSGSSPLARRSGRREGGRPYGPDLARVRSVTGRPS